MLTIVVLLAGFYLAWNIGANDVANAMGTSVGSKALTLKKAVFLAAVLEFCGAFFIGSSVSHTIQEGIVSPTFFTGLDFCLGMLGALIATGILLQVASYFGLPLSTTHAIVGSVLGFGLIAGGPETIQWSKLAEIAASWVLSPILSGVVSYAIFNVIQRRIFYALDPLEETQRLAPIFLFSCFFLISWSLFCDGLHLDLTFSGALTLCSSISFCGAFLGSYLMRRGDSLNSYHDTGSHVISLQVEKAFVALQIISACLVAFAHGANDVANAIGPVNAILSVAQSGSHVVPSWLLAFGGAGIVLGLSTWGWRVIETIGNKITELTPTRGFAAELGAATTILFASKLGLPISTTHALVGAVFGVGMARGLQALNLKILKEIVISWVFTIPVCAGLNICIYVLLKAVF